LTDNPGASSTCPSVTTGRTGKSSTPYRKHHNMMDEQNSPDIRYAETLTKYVRMASWVIAALLLRWAGKKITALSDQRFPWLVWGTMIYYLVYAIWMGFPWVEVKYGRIWKTGMIGYLVLSFFLSFS
jgi:hypothetical protein